MSWFGTKMRAMFGQSQPVSDPSHWLIRAINGGPTKAGVSVSEYSVLTFPAVYAAVSLIADTVAQLPLTVYRRTANGSEPFLEHPLSEALRLAPNPNMNSFILRNTVQHHLLLWGNGYTEIERNQKGEAIGLWPMMPDRTLPIKESGKDLYYRTTIDGKYYTLPPDRVLHVRGLGFDGYRGYSPVTLYRQAVGLGLAMEEFGAKFFANDAKSGGFLQHPGKLSDPARKNIKESIDAQGGLDNAHRVKLLEEGMKFVSTTIPPDDAQFLSSREFQVAEIARIYRVPHVLIGSMEKTTSWGTGIEQLMIGFVTWTIQPWITQWEQEMNFKLFTAAERKAGLFVKFNVNALLRGDMAARAAYYTAMFNIGSMNPNEIREKEDMNKYEGGEQYRVPLNTESANSDAPAAALPGLPQEGK